MPRITFNHCWKTNISANKEQSLLDNTLATESSPPQFSTVDEYDIQLLQMEGGVYGTPLQQHVRFTSSFKQQRKTPNPNSSSTGSLQSIAVSVSVHDESERNDEDDSPFESQKVRYEDTDVFLWGAM
jgi:hypothetical protein